MQPEPPAPASTSGAPCPLRGARLSPPGQGTPLQRRLPRESWRLCRCWEVWGGWGSRIPRPPHPLGQALGVHTPSRHPQCPSPGRVAQTPSPGCSPGLCAFLPAGTICRWQSRCRSGQAPRCSGSGKPPACSRKSRTRQSSPTAGGSAEEETL